MGPYAQDKHPDIDGLDAAVDEFQEKFELSDRTCDGVYENIDFLDLFYRRWEEEHELSTGK